MTITDSRPRHMYRLPDGREVTIIFDHGEVVPQTSTFTLEGGQVVPMTLVATADNLTDEQIRDLRVALLRESDNQFTCDTDVTGIALYDLERFPPHLAEDTKILKNIARGRCVEIVNARAKAVR